MFLTGAAGISADGLTLSGIGLTPQGDEGLWVVDLDYPLNWIFAGNFVRDENLTIDDVDALALVVVASSNDLKYDLNGDQVVETSDVQFWVTDIFGTWIGDVTLDGEFKARILLQYFKRASTSWTWRHCGPKATGMPTDVLRRTIS